MTNIDDKQNWWNSLAKRHINKEINEQRSNKQQAIRKVIFGT